MESQFDGQSAAASRGSGQQSAADDFPPLGGQQLNGEGPRRQAPGFGVMNGLGQTNGQNAAETMNGETGFGSAALRSPTEDFRSPTSILHDGPQEVQQQQPRVTSNPEQQLPFRDGPLASLQQAPIGQSAGVQQPHQGTTFGSQLGDATGPQQPTLQKRLTDMTEKERWGLPGLLAMLPGRGEINNPLVMGQDLQSLDMDFEK